MLWSWDLWHIDTAIYGMNNLLSHHIYIKIKYTRDGNQNFHSYWNHKDSAKPNIQSIQLVSTYMAMAVVPTLNYLDSTECVFVNHREHKDKECKFREDQ